MTAPPPPDGAIEALCSAWINAGLPGDVEARCTTADLARSELRALRNMLQDAETEASMATLEVERLRAKVDRLAGKNSRLLTARKATPKGKGQLRADLVRRTEELYEARAESAAYREALEEAVMAATVLGGPRSCGTHRIYTPQIGEETVERWRAALSRPGGEGCDDTYPCGHARNSDYEPSECPMCCECAGWARACLIEDAVAPTHHPSCPRAKRGEAGGADDRTLREAKP